MTINWKNVPEKALKLFTKLGVVDMTIKGFFAWIKKTAVKLFTSFKKLITGDIAKIQIKMLWEKYDDFESFWKGFVEFVNKGKK